MRIISVATTDYQTKEKQLFEFSRQGDGKAVVTNKGVKLISYLQSAFNESAECDLDVEVVFEQDGDKYSLRKVHGEENIVTTLRKSVDGKWQIIHRGKRVAEALNRMCGNVSAIVASSYVNNRKVEDYDGTLQYFDEVKTLLDVEQSAKDTADNARLRSKKAMDSVKTLSQKQVKVSREQLDAINAKMDEINRNVTDITAELERIRADHKTGIIRNDILDELTLAKQHYDILVSKSDDIDKQRAKLALRMEIEQLLPKITQLHTLDQEKQDYKEKIEEVESQLAWQESELASITQQLDEKQRQYVFVSDKRNKIDAINKQLNDIAELYERNRKLNESLLQLNEQADKFKAQRTLYQNRLDSVEKSIVEIKENLDEFEVPTKSIGELLETVRVDVKIDEVKSQIEKLQNEINVRESQIAEKESNLLVQVKKFKSVSDIDVAVSPMKAKDTILQVLEAKFGKLETINVSLVEKQRNFQRALEDYNRRIVELDNSIALISRQLDKALYRKQEEFKREVYINSQRSFNDTTSVFAVTANFDDEEITAMRQELDRRNVERTALNARANRLEGALREIARHIEINNAEMETLQKEKNNINLHYAEIIQQNQSEVVFNYIKALESNNGTKYLLDVQQDAVRCEAELADFKREVENMKKKLGTLKQRLEYLEQTQRQLNEGTDGIDVLVSTNDKLKDELQDLGSRLVTGYEQYRAVYRQLEEVDGKLDVINSAIVEVSKTIKVNEAHIAECTDRAKQLAESDDIEQAIANFKYDVNDVESELQVLTESKQATESETVKRRIEKEKLQWLLDSKVQEYNDVKEELTYQLQAKGISMDVINGIDFSTDVVTVKKVIADYDEALILLQNKIANYNQMLENVPEVDETAKRIAEMENKLADAMTRRQELEEERNQLLTSYVTANSTKLKMAVAAAEAEAISSLKNTVSHNEVIRLLIRDKIKSMLAVASQYACALAGKYVMLAEQGDHVEVTVENNTVEYSQLDNDVKTAVYVSLMLTLSCANSVTERWLVFDDKLNVNKKTLSAVLKNSNVQYVVAYNK